MYKKLPLGLGKEIIMYRRKKEGKVGENTRKKEGKVGENRRKEGKGECKLEFM